MSASSERPTARFDKQEALRLLNAAERAMDTYYSLTQRNAQDDIDLRVRLDDMREQGELAVPTREAMFGMYDAGLRPSLHGQDMRWIEAEWDQFLDEVTDATEFLHIRITEEA